MDNNAAGQDVESTPVVVASSYWGDDLLVPPHTERETNLYGYKAKGVVFILHVQSTINQLVTHYTGHVLGKLGPAADSFPHHVQHDEVRWVILPCCM